MNETMLLLVLSLITAVIAGLVVMRLFTARRTAREKVARDSSEKLLADAAAEAKRIEAGRRTRDDNSDHSAETPSATTKSTIEAAKRDAERKAAEDAARRDAERRAAEDAARRDAERRAAEDAARRDAERRAAEDAARRDAERRAAEDTARRDAERKAAEDAARRDAEHQMADARAAQIVERTTIEQAARHRLAVDAERREAERLARERKAVEEALRQEEEERLAVEQAILRERERQAAEAEIARQRPVTPKSKRPEETIVMIADDSRVVRVKTSRLLTAHRYQVATAEDGADAARQIALSPPDVLITDVDMPGLNGFQLSRHVRDNPRTARLPIIMVTSDSEQLRAEATEIGVNVVLGKPYPEEQLIAHIQQLVAEQGRA